MIDFGPVLSNPKLMLFGAAAQFGIFLTMSLASMFFPLNDAASIGVNVSGQIASVIAGGLILNFFL